MGAGLSQDGAAGRGARRRAKRQPMAEINVTPFVDVMLVLLIIFMVTAPLLTTGVPVELPNSEARASADTEDVEPLIVSVRPDGSVYLQETETTLDEIGRTLTAIAKGGKDRVIYVRGDSRANYGTLMRVMGKINAAGFQRIALVTGLDASN